MMISRVDLVAVAESLAEQIGDGEQNLDDLMINPHGRSQGTGFRQGSNPGNTNAHLPAATTLGVCQTAGSLRHIMNQQQNAVASCPAPVREAPTAGTVI
jgi:hypothetical protein